MIVTTQQVSEKDIAGPDMTNKKELPVQVADTAAEAESTAAEPAATEPVPVESTAPDQAPVNEAASAADTTESPVPAD